MSRRGDLLCVGALLNDERAHVVESRGLMRLEDAGDDDDSWARADRDGVLDDDLPSPIGKAKIDDDESPTVVRAGNAGRP